MAEIEGEEDGAWTGRQGSDLDGRNGMFGFYPKSNGNY